MKVLQKVSKMKKTQKLSGMKYFCQEFAHKYGK